MRMRIALLLIAALGAADVRAQQCVASTPVQESTGRCYIFGNGATCAPSPAAACDIACGGKMEYPGDGPYQNLYYCYLKKSGPFAGKCGTFELNTDHVQGFSELIERAACRRGYTAREDGKCIDKLSLAEDRNAEANGKAIERDELGNILQITDKATGSAIIKFGDYDQGRPGWYDDGVARVDVSWPAGGACLPSALTSLGYTSALTWTDPDHVATISTPLHSRKAVYSFNYYPDGELHMATSEIALYVSRLLITRAYSEAGDQIGYSHKFLPPETTTSAAVAPGTSVAVPQPAPDPFTSKLQPKVFVARTVPGGPLGVRLLGPLSFFYPFGQYLTNTIARFYMNVSASEDESLNDKCEAVRTAGQNACRKFWQDRTFNPDDLPSDNYKGVHIKCLRSVNDMYAACMRGEPLPSIALPDADRDVGNATTQSCYRQYAVERGACRVAAQTKYPGGTLSPYPHLYALDLYDCILSAQERLEQCRQGVALPSRTPLKLP